MLCELLVLDFGLSCNLHKLILRVVVAVALVQLTLEWFIDDARYGSERNTQKIAFEHGHSILWLVVSSFFCSVYTVVLLVPRVPRVAEFVQNPPFSITIPSKHGFYVYCATLAVVYWLLTIGTFCLVFNVLSVGFCLTDISTYLYYSFYALLLYRLLLSSVIRGDQEADEQQFTAPGMHGSAQYRPLMEEDGSDDELLNLGDQF